MASSRARWRHDNVVVATSSHWHKRVCWHGQARQAWCGESMARWLQSTTHGVGEHARWEADGEVRWRRRWQYGAVLA